MASNQMKLAKLASYDFTDLSEAEGKIIEFCATGDRFKFAHDSSANIENYLQWPAASNVRAEFIRWLLTDSAASKLVHPSGVNITGIRIQGRLQLRSIVANRSITIRASAIPEGIEVSRAELRHLDLSGSLVGQFSGDSLRVYPGDVFLRESFSTSAIVRLVGAFIAGDLDCHEAIFNDLARGALIADRSCIGGDVRLDDGFKAKGHVSFIGASVTGSFICSGAIIENPTGRALSLDNAKIGAGISLDKSFRATGIVALPEARVTGGIIVGGGCIETDDKNKKEQEKSDKGISNMTVDAERVQVLGDVLFDSGFTTNGTINLIGCCIDGDLSLKGARFTGDRDNGLVARGGEIKHGLRWQEVQLTPKTVLNLVHASADQLIDDKKSWPGHGNLLIKDFTYRMIGEGPFNAEERIDWLARQFAEQANSKGTAPSPQEPQFSLQPYEQLAGLFRRTGQESDAKKVAVAKEDTLRQHGVLNPINRFSSWFLGVTIKHGYGVERILVSGLLLLALGWIIFGNGYDAGLILKSQELNSSASVTYPSFSSFIYSVDTFLPIIDLHQEAYWLPDAEKSCSLLGAHKVGGGYFLRWYLWAHIALGWVISTLFVVSFTGLVRRE